MDDDTAADDALYTDEFYIMDASAVSGELHLWWKPNRRGYTRRLDEAGVYSRREAEQIQKIRGTDVPYRKTMVDAAAYRVVFQHDLEKSP